MIREPEAYIGDVAATAGVLAVLSNWLPPLAAAMSLVWFAVRIAETDTFARLTGWDIKQWRKDKENTK